MITTQDIHAERARHNAPRFWQVSTRRVGGLRFVKVGRLCVSFCITRSYRDINQPKHPAKFRLSDDGVLVLGFTNESSQARRKRDSLS